jgi:putative ABC transport system permease protein
MTINNLYRETISAITSNTSRSGLTMLGIVIGITSVIVMLAVGAGASNSIQSNIQGLGANLLQVYPGRQQRPGSQVSLGRGSASTLTSDDFDAVSTKVQGVDNITPVVGSQSQIIAKGTNTNTSVTGTTPSYAPVHSIDIAEGSFITDNHVRSIARVAVIGPTTRDDLFGVGSEAIGQHIRIHNLEFVVIGVTVAKGGSGFSNPDDRIYIPISVSQQMITGNRSLSSIDMQVTNQADMSTIKDEISSMLLTRHKITDPASPDFSFLDQASISATVSTVTGILTILLGSIAGISLVVGGIGIMNMMLTTVTERTREIGLRKAIGAKSNDISNQFLAEAVALTTIGGVIGIILGYGLSFLITLSGLITASVSVNSVLMAFGVAAVTGIVFGYFPARKAAKLNPIDALRYE